VIAFSAAPAPAAEATARIYVYAQELTEARSWIAIQCDGVAVARITRGKFFAVNVTPGRHTLASETGVPVVVDVHAGEDSFARLDWHFEIGRAPVAVLHLVQPEAAHQELKFLSYIDKSKIMAPSVSKSDPRDWLEPRLKTR